jgi:YD repeat-containing protein
MRSDLEKYDLSGAVRSVEIVSLRYEEESGEHVEKPFHTQRMAFNTQGHLTESSSFSPDGASFRMAYTYDAESRLSETNYYDTGGVLSSRTLYRYDGQGRLEREINYNADGAEADSKTFSYDAEGRKIEKLVLHRVSLEHEAAQVCDTGGSQGEGASCETQGREVTVGVEGSDSLFAVPGAHVVETFYDARGNAAELRFYGAREKPLGRIVFTYNEAGKLSEEVHYGLGEMFACGPQARLARLFSPVLLRLAKATLFLTCVYSYAVRREWRKAARSFRYGTLISETVYAYDAEGRRTERALRMAGRIMHRMGYAYDERGDKVEEIEYEEDNSLRHKALFAREYDAHGNWTSEVVSVASTWDIEFGTSMPSSTTRRTITYY